MPRGAALIRAGSVSLEIGEPIQTAGVAASDRDALIAQVRGRVAAMLGESDEPGQPGAPRSPSAPGQ